jgi:hypothetical protein
MNKRFQIKMDPYWRPLLLLGGATSSNSFVEVGADYVAFNFGFAFHYRIPRDEVKAVFPRSWPFWYGIGWRSNFRGVIGIVGSYEDVVEVRLNKRRRAWAAFPMDRIGVSLEDPKGFIAAFTEFAEPKKTPARKPAPIRATAAAAAKPKPKAKVKAATKVRKPRVKRAAGTTTRSKRARPVSS